MLNLSNNGLFVVEKLYTLGSRFMHFLLLFPVPAILGFNI